MVVLRDILVNLFAGFIADLSSPHGMIGIWISLGLTIYLIVSWHRKRIAGESAAWIPGILLRSHCSLRSSQ